MVCFKCMLWPIFVFDAIVAFFQIWLLLFDNKRFAEFRDLIHSGCLDATTKHNGSE